MGGTILDGGLTELDGHDGGGAGAFDTLVLDVEGAVGGGDVGFGEPAAAEEAENVAEKDEEEEAPDDPLKLPPAALEFEIFADGDRVVDLGN